MFQNVSTNSVSKIQGTTFQKLQMKDNDYKSTVLKKPLAQQIIPFIVCEICDGYLRHFNDYKTHLLLVHQVEAKTPKPPLDCTKCIER